MSDLVTLRNSLASSLSAAGRVVYAFPREQITPPAIVLVPASPYIMPMSIGGLTNRLNVRFAITVVVGAADNQAALANIETLMLAVFDLLPPGASVDQWTQPVVVTIGSNEMLTSQLTIELVTTNNEN